MFIESVSEFSQSLANVLFAAILASETVDHIRASTADVFHAGVLLLGVVTCDFS